MSRTFRPREQVFAILRFDSEIAAEHGVTVKEVVRDLAMAEAEVARLNALKAGKGCRYEWQATRLYPVGSAAGQDGDAPTTEPGYVNRNGQRVVRETGLPGTDHLQFVYVLRCRACGAEYGANGSDIYQRRCPSCQDGASGLPY